MRECKIKYVAGQASPFFGLISNILGIARQNGRLDYTLCLWAA